MSTPTVAATPGSASWARDAATLTRRILLHWRQRPVSIGLALLFPVLIVLMFRYLFGGAMAVPDGTYTDYLIPGMLTITMLFGLESVTLAVTMDTAKGVTERIRTMPVSGIAVLAGRSWADLINGLAGLAVMVTTGLIVGWRPEHGLVPTLTALGLLLWLRFAFSWIGIYLGLLLKTPESAVTVQVLVWPIGFLSSAFVSPHHARVAWRNRYLESALSDCHCHPRPVRQLHLGHPQLGREPLDTAGRVVARRAHADLPPAGLPPVPPARALTGTHRHS